MTAGSILLGIALLLLVVLFLARPFLRDYWQPPAISTTPYDALLAEKEALLDQIRVLDFDHETGKMPTAVYQPQRQKLIGEAAIVLEQMDSLNATTGLDAEIEAAIAGHRQVVPQPEPDSAARYCPNCGQLTDTTDNFCAACGHKLKAAS